jgi:hypothetical protein
VNAPPLLFSESAGETDGGSVAAMEARWQFEAGALQQLDDLKERLIDVNALSPLGYHPFVRDGPLGKQ